MLTATSGLSQIRPHYTAANRDLMKVLLNATSPTEANLALEVLKDSIPEKALVSCCNLREVLAALPTSPFSMRVDEAALMHSARFEKDLAALRKELPDNVEVVVTLAGNLVLDLIVKYEGEKFFWSPVPVTDDFINPEVVDVVIDSPWLLEEIIEVVKCMGIVFNPRFYLSLEDWHMDYAEAVFDGLGDLF
jgi:hypothetical protein